MLAKRLVVPLSVLTAGSAAAVGGSVGHTVAGQWTNGCTGDVRID